MHKIRSFVLVELLDPIARRIGTGVSGYLIGAGVESDTVNVIATGLVAALGVIVDLALSHKARAR